MFKKKSDNTNTGNRNSGDWNSGNRNSGDWNSGNSNSGNRNSGDWNSGNRNSGDRNSGDRNSGDWNSGDRNSGYFNVDEPKVRIFGKETDIERKDLMFPHWFFFGLCHWVDEADMTNEEKVSNDQYKVTGGFLKTLDYKEAWRKAWDSVGDAEHRKVLDLPNFDNAIFLEITGIDVAKELNESSEEKIEIEGKKYSVTEIKAALNAAQREG